MAALLTFLLLFSFAGLSQSQVVSVGRFTSYIELSSCTGNTPAQYFNSVLLRCEDCPTNTTTNSDRTACVCRPGFRLTKDFGAGEVACFGCRDDEATSESGWECVKCEQGTTVDVTTKKCTQCSGERVNVFRNLNGAYLSAETPPPEQCQHCKDESQLNANKTRCERCDISLSLGLTSCNCTTPKLKGICFDNENNLPADQTSLYLIPLDGNTVVRSTYLEENIRADYVLCNDKLSALACQALANMCVLLYYDAGSSILQGNRQACTLFRTLNQQATRSIRPDIYTSDSAEKEIVLTEITTQWTVDPVVQFPFVVGTWSLDGNFEGMQNITGKFLQLCEAPDQILDAAFTFGTFYSYSCSIPALNLWNQVKYPLKFYELYLRYTKEGNENLFRIPVKIQNYRAVGGSLANEGERIEWQLMRRFFLVDNVMAQVSRTSDVEYVRYVKDIRMEISLQDKTADGLIYIPLFEITYGYVKLEDAQANALVQVSFTTTYSMDQFDYFRNFQIATGVMSSLALLYAGFRSYVWSKRAGRLSIDFPTLVNFFFYVCGSLANAFFVITYGISFYFFIFYKRQNVIFLVPLEGQPLEDWKAIFITGFVLKALSLIHLIIMQCSADLFLVDWERPKGQAAIGAEKKQPNTVSIWRTYFVANEWNEIQAKRKINKVFQIFAVVFFLHVIGFENTTTKDPDGTVGKSDDVYQSEQSEMFRMALACTVYLLVAMVQVVFFVLIYERFITDDIREFVDLCSMSNVSVFVMANAEFGYYIHGRSVHGRSDVNMQEMCDMIKREEDNLVGMRGLQPNTEAQTFIMSLPKRLRQKYETVYMPVQLENASAASRAEQGRPGVKDKSIEAYSVLNRFLCAFIDHSMQDVDYVVKDKNFLEKVLDTEFLEMTDKGIFYNDNGHSFDNILFYGNELFLIIFDTFLFSILDFMAQDFVLAGIITYIIIEGVSLARETGGKKNLAKKTLVDERFLI